jgi:putative flippase GtrA
MSAVTVTWLFNRSFTFNVGWPREHTLLREWVRYVVSQLGGFGVNYAVYAVLVSSSMVVLQWPVLGVAAGSVAGLVANYLLAKRYVFSRQKLGE